MKNKKKILIGSIIIAIILAITLISFLLLNSSKNELLQLSPQGSRQMMGYLLKTSTGKLIAIDGGTLQDTNHLIEQIRKNGGKVDYWFLTHAHDDHVGAFVQIVKNKDIEISHIYASLNEYEWYEENEPQRADFSKQLIDTLNELEDKVEEPYLNQIIQIDNIKVEILGVKNPEITENAGNEQSMVIKFDTGKTKLLILGDTGTKSSEKLLKNQKDKLKSDIVQMAHHGQAGATQELYKQINPSICLWPTPEWLWNNDSGSGENTGNWKTFETREWIKKLNVKKNYIAKDGDVNIKLK